MAEAYSILAEESFRNAMMDATMLIPDPGTDLLFDSSLFDIRMGGDASITGSNRQITLPIPKTIITIGLPYGTEIGYPGEFEYVDTEIQVPFSVWSLTGATQTDTQRRLLFARDSRSFVFSNYGLTLVPSGIVRGKPRNYLPVDGLLTWDYAWKAFYSRGSRVVE